MPDDLKAKFPNIYSVQKLGEEARTVAKYEAINGWEWYPVEFDGRDRFYGLVFGFALEVGYFSLKEIASAKHEMSNGVLDNAVYRNQHYVAGETIAEARQRCEQSWRYRLLNRKW